MHETRRERVVNARAIAGKPMFTIEVSSVVMKIPTHTSATTGAPVAVRFAGMVVTPPARPVIADGVPHLSAQWPSLFRRDSRD